MTATDPVQREDPASSDSGCEDVDGPSDTTTHHVSSQIIHLGERGGGREGGKEIYCTCTCNMYDIAMYMYMENMCIAH